MAKKKVVNSRCPLQCECERKCEYVNSEHKCDYFYTNLRPEHYDDVKKNGIMFDCDNFRSIDMSELSDVLNSPDDEVESCYDDFGYLICEAPSVSVETSVQTSGNVLNSIHDLTNKIYDALEEAGKQFIYIGFLLDEADRLGTYKQLHYKNIYQYCEMKFGFQKSTTNNFLRVYRRFGERIGLAERYKDYTYSQLTEMCSMSDEQLNNVNPGMSVRSIRDYKKRSASDYHSSQFSVELDRTNYGLSYLPDWLQSKISHLLVNCDTLNIIKLIDDYISVSCNVPFGYLSPDSLEYKSLEQKYQYVHSDKNPHIDILN